jgi:hypothetical protein
MELIIKTQKFTTNAGNNLTVEEYQSKYAIRPFYRYILDGVIISDMLFRKPNIKRLINNL